MVETVEPKAVCGIRLEAAITVKCISVHGSRHLFLPFNTIVHMTCNSQSQLYITLYYQMLYEFVCIIISNRVIGKLNSILQALGPYNNQRRSQLGRLSKQDCNGMYVALQHETLTRDGTEK